jgi:hypothetical protein
MSVETLERPQTIRFRPAREIHSTEQTPPSGFEPNFGPDDMHAIKAIAYI